MPTPICCTRGGRGGWTGLLSSRPYSGRALGRNIFFGTQTYLHLLSESNALSEATSAAAAFAPAVSETATTAEVLAAQLGASVAVSESASLTEALAVALAATQGASESVAVAEVLAAQLAAGPSVAESASLTEAVAALAAFAPAVSELLAVLEAVAEQVGRYSQADLAESVSLGEAVSAVRDVPVALAEGATLLEALAARLDAAAALAEGAAVTETATGSQDHRVSLAEGVSVVEAALTRLIVRIQGATRALRLLQPRREIVMSTPAIISAGELGELPLQLTESGRAYPLDLTSVTVVVVHRQTGARDERAVTVVDASTGSVRAVWPPHTLAPGLYDLQVHVTPLGGEPMVWPRDRYETLLVRSSL